MHVHAAVSINEVPLFLSINVTPNVILTLDNSGSMSQAYMPDKQAPNGEEFNLKRYSSYPWNAQYYNPNTTYSIPTRRDNVSYSTSFNQAYSTGFDKDKTQVNLSNTYTLIESCNPGNDCVPVSCVADEACDLAPYINVPAFYHQYYADIPKQSLPQNCEKNREDEDCYVKIIVGSNQDMAPGTSSEQKQNFANWYSFYRTRALATMSAATMAVSALDENQIRLAWLTISHDLRANRRMNPNCVRFGTTCQGYDNLDHENRLRPLDAFKTNSSTVSHRTDFYDWIARMQFGSGTPLRSALQNAGEYYKTKETDNTGSSPYAEEPYVKTGTVLSCRKNYNIVFTDGLWNGQNTTDFGGNIDSASTKLPDGKTYTAQPPYSDSNTQSLSDIAFKYWAQDLRDDLANNLTPKINDRSGDEAAQYWNPQNDPATWQHMTNFMIGLGLTRIMKSPNPEWAGSTYAGSDYDALLAGTQSWPATQHDVVSGQEPDGHVYDLWHAAINSRGQFFSADNPDQLKSAFKTVFSSILSANSSASSVAANSTSVLNGALIYRAALDSTDWHGQLTAHAISSKGTIGAEIWDAGQLIPAASSRHIYTWNGNSGKEFASCNASLSREQKLALNTNSNGTVDNLCTERLEWLRGSSANEVRNGGSFRNRTASVLGDIVHSDPIFVKDMDYGYAFSDLPSAEKDSYAAFVASKKSRIPMVYAGANDGMLHGFRADIGNNNSGKEIFAYIPAGVYSKLSRLTDPAYNHTYYVDGSPIIGDAYWGNSWRTVLVGSLGAGGKSVFALDITHPEDFTTSHVLWEFSDENLGLTMGQPQIARMNNGEWAVIFANGYNSGSGNNDKAYLYVVKLSNGELLKRIAVSSITGNGLSTPKLFDSDMNGTVDGAYAGDLKGNLWRFDFSDTSKDSWGIANNDKPIFTAVDPDKNPQPITTQPELMTHSLKGLLVFFGTGIYMSSSDVDNKNIQSFYGIWDNHEDQDIIKRSQLQQQTIDHETLEFSSNVRDTSAHAVNWETQRGWYMDLIPPENGAPVGERVIFHPLIRYDRVIFITAIPSTNPCSAGGDSWLMELDYTTGARTTASAFDLNGDFKFNTFDLLTSGHAAGGIKTSSGIGATPTWLEGSLPTAVTELSSSDGTFRYKKDKSSSDGGVNDSGNNSEDEKDKNKEKVGFDLKVVNGSGGKETIVNRRPSTVGTVERIFWQQIQ